MAILEVVSCAKSRHNHGFEAHVAFVNLECTSSVLNGMNNLQLGHMDRKEEVCNGVVWFL